jgi:hypothetical protein
MPEHSHHSRDAWRVTPEGQNLRRDLQDLYNRITPWSDFFDGRTNTPPTTPRPTQGDYDRVHEIIARLKVLQQEEQKKEEARKREARAKARGLTSPEAIDHEDMLEHCRTLYKSLEADVNAHLAKSGTSERTNLSRETSRLPEYWTLRHTEVINEVLGFTEDKLAETMVPSFESLLSLNVAYLDAFYPTTKVEEPYLAFRPSWFSNPATDIKTASDTEAFPGQTFWQVYQQAQQQTLRNLQGGLILIDPSCKPNHNPDNTAAQQYTTATGGPDPLLPLLREFFSTTPDAPPHRFWFTDTMVARFCTFLKNKIIARLATEGLHCNSEDISVVLPPFTLMNILMTTDPRFQPSSTTDTLERCADLITAGPAGTLEDPRALFCGNSDRGGAAYCYDRHAGDADGDRGFRPAVIVRTT